MTVFDNIKNLNIDEFVDWLDENILCDNAPWWKHFDDNYCSKCIAEIDNRNHKCGYCELNGKCRYFQDLDNIPDRKQIIKMWLASEFVENGNSEIKFIED